MKLYNSSGRFIHMRKYMFVLLVGRIYLNTIMYFMLLFTMTNKLIEINNIMQLLIMVMNGINDISDIDI